MKFVCYHRVSTKRQGKSGLGLEAQKRDIQLYLDNYAETSHEVIGEYTDIESGANADRVDLAKAIELAKATGATLLIAKLDRLSRSVAFIAKVMEQKNLNLRIATMPNADKFQLHIYAALAEQEREFISIRTKTALAAAKARGVKLGGVRPNQEKSRTSLIKIADDNAMRVKTIIKDYRASGKAYRYIANQLNTLSVPTANGGKWYDTTVRRYDLRSV